MSERAMNEPSVAFDVVIEPSSTVEHRAPKSSLVVRAGSVVVLCFLVFAVAYIGRTAYLAATDSFVAPMILSPDNDLVLAHKQKVMELEGQHSLAVAQAEGVDADLTATSAAEQRLFELQGLATSSTDFTRQVTTQQSSAGTADIVTLDSQRELLTQMHDRQREITERAKANFESGLLTQIEFEKEQQNLRQSELALLENSRARARADANMNQVMLSSRAFSQRGSPMSPEMTARHVQLIQVQLELLRLQSERRAKTAERRVLAEKIANLDELRAQLRERPMSQAIDKSLFAAFVPYTQMDGVKPGGHVYRCMWGIFRCKEVGAVADLVPGEVTMPDPWGNPARGQFILLTLSDTQAATAKVLRVRASKKDGA
jgi:hypothetical protein